MPHGCTPDKFSAPNDLEPAGTASNLPETLAALEQHEPAVVITGIHTPATSRAW